MNWTTRFAGRTAHLKRSAVREFLKVTAQPEMISFAGGLPAPELFPMAEIQDATNAVFQRQGGRALQYGETEGLAELRDWIAQNYSNPHRPGANPPAVASAAPSPPMRLSRDNVLIVSGAQQGLDLLGRIFLNPGDAVLVENPTYLALLSAWRPHGIAFDPVACDDDGLRIDHLREQLGQTHPKLLYTIPNFQNPQGVTLAPARRRELVELARQQNIGLVEDDAYGELRYEGTAAPSLFELDAVHGPESGNVIHVGTFSKVLVPGLRVGWVIAPATVVEQLVRAKQACDLHTGSLSQHIILELLRRDYQERQIPFLRRAYRERRDAMLAALEQSFPPDCRWTRPAGGMFLMVTLPTDVDVSALLKESLQRRVAFVPGEEFHLDGAGRNTLRLNFTNADPERIAVGIRRLAEALQAVRSRRRSRRRGGSM